MKRPFQPHNRRHARRHGFRHRMETRAGRAVLKGAPPEGPAPPGSLTWRTRGRSAFEGLRRASTVRSGPFTLSWLPAVPGQPPALAFTIGKR